MPRLQRIHVPGGLYYVRHRSSTERAIFKDNDDYAQFEAILAHALEQFEIRAHAFCWQPGSIHLAVEIGTIQLSRFIQAVASRYVSVAKLRKEYSTQLDTVFIKSITTLPKVTDCTLSVANLIL